jgi:hypothetical protein
MTKDPTSKESLFEEPTPEEFEKITQPYQLAIGRVALAWNGLQESLADLFWVTLGIENGVIPGAVWHALQSDRLQRQVLKAAVKARWANDAKGPSINN